MEQCEICGRDLFKTKEDILKIPFDPALYVADCNFCGTGNLIYTPMKKDWSNVKRSFSTSPALMEEKRKQIKDFLYYVYTNTANPKIFELGGMDEFADLGIKKITEFNHEENDAFVLLYYLEHFPTPTTVINDLYDVLKPGGYGLIQVPNYTYIKETRNWLEYTQEHRLYYTEFSLTYLLIHCGFEIVKVNYYNDGLCLSIIVRKPLFQNINVMEEGMRLDREKFRELINKLPTPIVFYGAGHYAQLLLSMAKERYNWSPARIFDSNKSKVGLAINEVVIERKDDMLIGKDFKSIIVCCGMYNDEVYEMLKKSDVGNKEIVKWN
jgi:SAM-dependent methyltransferase